MNKKSFKITAICLGLLVLIIAAVYGYVSYVNPYRKIKRLEKLSAAALAFIYGCPDQDEKCKKVIKNIKKLGEIKTESHELASPVENILKNPDFITLLKHPDGSFCFLTHEPNREISDSELQEWLGKYGEKKYMERVASFMLGKDLFESMYHKPRPKEAMANAAKTLKRKESFFSQQWSDLNFTQRFYEWSMEPKKTQKLSVEMDDEILRVLREYGIYFDQSRILRMNDLAKVALTKARLSDIHSALEKFAMDVGSYSMKNAEGDIELNVLVSIDRVPDLIHERWKGPYLKSEDLLKDMWFCEIMAKITDGVIQVWSYGSDCANGGDGMDADISVTKTQITKIK